MNDDKKIMSIFALAYLLLAEASKQQPSKEGFLQILELLGEDGIQECAKVADQGPEAVAKTMVEIIKQKSALKAANGAKLQYLRQLKGLCPEGYLKNGGRCKPCEQKAAFGNKADLFEEGGDFDRSRVDYSINKNKKLNNMSNISNDYRTNPENNKPQGSNNLPDWLRLGSLNKPAGVYPTRKPVFPKSRPLSNSLGQIPLYEGNLSPYPYRITREIYEPLIPGFMPGIEGYPRHYNGGVLKFQGGGPTISDYRRRHHDLRRLAYERALTTEEGVPTGPSFTLRGTSNSPIRLQGVTVTTPARPEYHRQRGRDGGYHEWISPYGSPGNIDLTDPSNLIGPYRYTTSNGRTTYYRYDSPDRFTPMSSRLGERLFNRAKRKSAPAKELEGGPLWNRIWGAVSGEGVNGVGTRFNPVLLNNVEVTRKARYPYIVDRRRLDLNNGYGVTSDMIYRASDQYTDWGPLLGLRTIYEGPQGNDTTYQDNLENSNIRWIDYGEGYMPIANGENSARGKTRFNRAYNKTTPNSRREMNK